MFPFGVTRFDAFEERLRISKRILTERLQKLVKNFILMRPLRKAET